MDVGGYKIREQNKIHFLTFTVVVPMNIGRVDIFTRDIYKEIILESLKFCQKESSFSL
jgi:putative transposase